MEHLDAVIIAGDLHQEVLGAEVREKARLLVDGTQAGLPFLVEYFRSGRDSRAARAKLQDEEQLFLSLNGPYLSQFLEAQGFTTTTIPVLSAGRAALLAALDRQPTAVIISTTFLPFAKQIDAIAALVKKHAPDTTVIAGGIQVWKSYKHRLLLDDGCITEDILPAVAEHNYLLDPTRPSPVDILVVSDTGEHTLARILETLRQGDDVRALANVAWFENGRWQLGNVTPEQPEEVRVDWRRALERPTRAYVPVQAGLGCKFHCEFCDFTGLRPVRERSAASVVDEIAAIPPLKGVRRVYFTDDNLFATRRRLREICSALMDSGMNVRWRGLARIDIVDDETADLMARAGCIEVLLGIESGDPEILRRMRKRVSPERILEGIASLTRHGINTKSTFIVGFPGETEQSVRRTIELLNSYPTDGAAAHRYLLFQYAVLPLSSVATPEARSMYGLRGYGYHWKHNTMSSKEALEHMEAIPSALKPELSPSYMLEVPEVEGLDNRDISAVYRIRNELVRRPESAETEADALWDALESVFRPL